MAKKPPIEAGDTGPDGTARSHRYEERGGAALHVLQRLRMTPAMGAGVTLWEVADIVALLEATEAEEPTCAGHTRA